MDISISTSDPDNVDPEVVAQALEAAGFLVISVDVNDGDRTWEMDEPRDPRDDEPMDMSGPGNPTGEGR